MGGLRPAWSRLYGTTPRRWPPGSRRSRSALQRQPETPVRRGADEPSRRTADDADEDCHEATDGLHTGTMMRVIKPMTIGLSPDRMPSISTPSLNH